AQRQRALNRERTNVGRSAYQDRVKAILLKATSDVVAEQLAQDLTHIPAGTNHDEVLWLDVQEQAVRILATKGKTVFVTSQQLFTLGAAVQEAQRDGCKEVVLPAR